MAARTFPMLREDGRFIVEAVSADASGAFPMVADVADPEARAFIIAACNTHSSIKAEGARLEKARADLAEHRLREALGEPAPAEFGFYAGLSLDKLSVGPHPTFDAALDAARHEHGASKSIFVVEAKPAEAVTNVFGSVEIDRVLQWIEDANAYPSGRDGVLPPMRQHHEEDLAKRLNTAVRQWMTANGINLITASLGEARSHTVVIPHEVDSVTTRPVSGGSVRLAPDTARRAENALLAAIGPSVGEAAASLAMPDPWFTDIGRVELTDEYKALLFPGSLDKAADASPHGSMCCTECRSPMRCAEEGCNAGYVSRFEPVHVEDPGFHTWATETNRHAAVSTPAGPHTGDMNAMLDDLGGASC